MSLINVVADGTTLSVLYGWWHKLCLLMEQIILNNVREDVYDGRLSIYSYNFFLNWISSIALKMSSFSLTRAKHE